MESLYPYQLKGARFLADRPNAFLADAMGIGKSCQAIVACDLIKARTILVLCPASVCVHWQREFIRFQTMHRPVKRLAGDYDVSTSRGVLICSFDMASKDDIHALLMQLRWEVLIIDEAHFLKNCSSKRTKAVLGEQCDRMGGLVETADRVYALSGTPAPNDPAELWPILHALFPEVITREGQIMDYLLFRDRYCHWHQREYRVCITGGRNLTELRTRMKPFLLRRRKEDVLKDLPPIRFEEVFLSPEGSLSELWEAENGPEGRAIKAILEQHGDLEETVHLAKLRRLTGLAKVKPVLTLLNDELKMGLNKVVVFAYHTEVIKQLAEGLAPFGVVVLQGSTPSAQRQVAIDRFQTEPNVRIFIGQLSAAGTGIALTAASHALFVESSWTPADNLQAAMRIHRIGQRDSVLIRFCSLAGSLDEAVTSTVRRKTAILAQIFD